MKIGEIYRYARPYAAIPAIVNDLPNHFAVTKTPGHNLALLDSGINPLRQIQAIDSPRRPAILIRSTPHKTGSSDTPWQDSFDVDNGHIRYFGDNKEPGNDPDSSKGNKVLLRAFQEHSSPYETQRKEAVPLIFYRAVPFNGKQKGYVEFNGFGIIRDVQLVTQYDRAKRRTFSNYIFDFTVFSLAAEFEEFSWDWVSARRNQNTSLGETQKFAPVSWQNWIKGGSKVLETARRRVSRLHTLTTQEQKPTKGSKVEKALNEIYEFYNGRKARFEALAARVTASVINESGNGYSQGWITAASSDGGADYYGKMTIGSGFGQAKLIVLGQAKCESPSSPTGGNHIARTVARLKRGWVGVYVTTSYFSEAVQREVIEDSYPLLLINGSRLAESCLKIVHDGGYESLRSLLEEVDQNYEQMVQARRPEELLLE